MMMRTMKVRTITRRKVTITATIPILDSSGSVSLALMSIEVRHKLFLIFLKFLELYVDSECLRNDLKFHPVVYAPN